MRRATFVTLGRERVAWPRGVCEQIRRQPIPLADHAPHAPAQLQRRLQHKQLSHAAAVPPRATSSSFEAPAKRQRLLTRDEDPQQLHRSTATVRSDSLSQLQSFLGYRFRRPQLLEQACTHSSNKAVLSYRQLAFLGDAALWMLFAEHAFNTYGHVEAPTSGAWPARLSAILSRASCAATAREWGLQQYLQHDEAPHHYQHYQQQQQQQDVGHATPTGRGSSSSSSSGSSSSGGRSSSSMSSSNSNGSSSSKGRSGMHQGAWSSDSLAEMFEGLVGALLLDSDYGTVQKVLQPWVAAAFDQSRSVSAAAAASPSTAAAAAAGDGDGEACGDPVISSSSSSSNGEESLNCKDTGHLQLRYVDHVLDTTDSVTDTVLSSSSGSSSSSSRSYRHQQGIHDRDIHRLTSLLQQQLQNKCAYDFQNRDLLQRCSRHVLLLLTYGSSGSEDEKWHFLGYSVLQYAAAWHAYRLCCMQRADATTSNGLHMYNSDSSNSSSSSSASVSLQQQQQQHGSSNSSDDEVSSGSSSRNIVQLMSKQMVSTTIIRHRCKMWLWLGMDPVAWSPAGPYLYAVKWKVQKQLISRCLDLLLAAVYLDGGLDAALHVVEVLLQCTPPTGLDKSWIPSWANKGAAAAALSTRAVAG